MRLTTKQSAYKLRVAGVAALCLLVLGNASLAQTLQPKAQKPAPAGAAPPAQPQAAPPQPTWMVACTNIPGGFDCRASQTLMSQNSRQRILTLVVRRSPEAKKPVMMIQGPLGIYLPAGVAVQIGTDAAKVLPLQSCDQGGCVTEFAMTDAEIETMRGGADLTVTMQDQNKAPVTLKVPGLGFAEAYAKVE